MSSTGVVVPEIDGVVVGTISSWGIRCEAWRSPCTFLKEKSSRIIAWSQYQNIQSPRSRSPIFASLFTFCFDRINLNNVTLRKFLWLFWLRNRFDLLISSQTFKNGLLNLKNKAFFEVNLIFFTFSHYLTSKLQPHLKPYLFIDQSPCFITHLTSRNNPFRDHLCT